MLKKEVKKIQPDLNLRTSLPKALMSASLFRYHTLEEAVNFAKASSQANEAYEKLILALHFVDRVVKGAQDEAEKMLQANPTLIAYLLSQKVRVKDLSGRTFFNITAFEYAVWALDRHMWTMLKKYMTKEEMKKQLFEMESRGGVEYQLPTTLDEKAAQLKTRREMHYNFNELINALENYVRACNGYDATPRTHDFQNIKDTCKVLGDTQFTVPVHVANEYCHPYRSFESIPNFKEDKSLPRTYRVSSPKGGWFSVMDPKRIDGQGAVFRATWSSAYVERIWGRNQEHDLDLRAIKALCEARILELTELKDLLFQDMKEEEKGIGLSPIKKI